MTLHKAGNPSVTNIALEREEREEKTKKKDVNYITGYSYLVIQLRACLHGGRVPRLTELPG